MAFSEIGEVPNGRITVDGGDGRDGGDGGDGSFGDNNFGDYLASARVRLGGPKYAVQKTACPKEINRTRQAASGSLAASLHEPYRPHGTFVSVLDGFVVSPGVEVIAHGVTDLAFKNADHNPTWLEVHLR